MLNLVIHNPKARWEQFYPEVSVHQPFQNWFQILQKTVSKTVHRRLTSKHAISCQIQPLRKRGYFLKRQKLPLLDPFAQEFQVIDHFEPLDQNAQKQIQNCFTLAKLACLFVAEIVIEPQEEVSSVRHVIFKFLKLLFFRTFWRE